MLFTTVKELYRTDSTDLPKHRQLYVTLDTETATDNAYTFFNNGVQGYNSLVYDVGLLVHDLTGNVYGTLNLVANDVFTYERAKMDSSYYHEKLQSYYTDIDNKVREVVSIQTIKDVIDYIVNELNITTIEAYNIKFDYEALNHTYHKITQNYIDFFPKATQLIDIKKMAHRHIYKNGKYNRRYKKFCEVNNCLTNHAVPRPNEKAETVYKYITKNTAFTEAHTGLKDCEIEKDIMIWLNRKDSTLKTNSSFKKYARYEVEMA